MEAILFLLGRIVLGVFFIMNGRNHLKQKESLIAYAKAKKAPKPDFFVPATGYLMIVGGIGIILWIFKDLVLLALLAFMIPMTIMMHDYWNEKEAGKKATEEIAFMKNMAIVGSLLIMFMI